MRQERAPEELEDAANQLQQAAIYLRNVASKLHAAGLPTILIHGATSFGRISALVEWSRKVEIEADSQIDAYRRGVQSKHAYDKQRDARAKSARRKKVTG